MMKVNSARMTLIELLVAIAILTLLAGFVLGSLGPARRRALDKADRALLLNIQTALRAYFEAFNDYPPDGFDGAADPGYSYASGGVELGGAWSGSKRVFKNSGCLVYFLCLPVTKVSRVGAVVPGEPSSRTVKREVLEPFLKGLSARNFSIENFRPELLASDASLAVVEIVDSRGRPIEYDKVVTPAQFQAERFDGDLFGDLAGLPHWSQGRDFVGASASFVSDCGQPEMDDQSYDPRRAYDSAGCLDLNQAPQALSGGHFDLWSHGAHWTDPIDDIVIGRGQ